MLRLPLFLFLFIASFSAHAQAPAIGQWRDHFPYSNAIDVVYTPTKVFVATKTAVFYLDFEDNSLNRLTKVNALSDIGIVRLAYDGSSNKLIVGYSNGNLDLIDASSNSTVNLSDIKRSNIVGDKSIYGILPIGGKAYLATGFGIIYLDIDRQEIKETYYLSPSGSSLKVNEVALRGDSIYAATENGLYVAYKLNPFLSDYTSWTKITDLPTGVINREFSSLVNFNNDLVAVYSSGIFNQDSVYRYDGTSWTSLSQFNNLNILDLKVRSGKLISTSNYAVQIHDPSYATVDIIFSYVFNSSMTPSAADFGNGLYWIADKNFGLVSALNTWSNSRYIPSGPYSPTTYKMKFNKGDLWVSHGVVYGSAWLNSYSRDFVSGRIDETWYTLRDFQDPNSVHNIDTLFDFLALAIDPDDSKHVFAGSLSFGGIVELNNNTFIGRYDEANSSLQAWPLRPGYCGIADLLFDKDKNLWALNTFINKALSVKKADNTWKSFDLGPNMQGRTYKEMLFGKNTGLLWVAVPSTSQSGGLFVWDNKGTIDDVSDDQYFMYKNGTGQGNLPSADVLCIAEDLDEEIWVGTGAGVVVVYNQQAVFSGGNFDAQQILIEQDGNIQILLETETITGIAVDGANRKWIATDGSGVYLMSADGTEQLAHFTTQNSPLLSNQLVDVEIDHTNGEVYFATSEGVISYRGTATIEPVPFASAHAFPNPVMPDYTGVIAIKGLGRDADVKITDIAGNVVFVTKSEGGQAIWDGKNLKGERVATGVYTVLCNSSTGKGKVVAKIMFYN